jgi:hypothetical protein
MAGGCKGEEAEGDDRDFQFEAHAPKCRVTKSVYNLFVNKVDPA